MKLVRTFNLKLREFVSQLADIFLKEKTELPQTIPYEKIASWPEFQHVEAKEVSVSTLLMLMKNEVTKEYEKEHKQNDSVEQHVALGYIRLYRHIYQGYLSIPPVSDQAETNLKRTLLWVQALCLCDEYSDVILKLFTDWISPIEDDVFKKNYEVCKENEFFLRLGTEHYWSLLDKEELDSFWSSVIQMVQHKGMYLTCGNSLGELEQATQEFMAQHQGQTDLNVLGDELFQQILQGGKLSQTIQNSFLKQGSMLQMAQNLLGTAMRAPGSDRPDLTALKKVLDNPELEKAMKNNEINEHLAEARNHLKGMSIKDLQAKALSEMAKTNDKKEKEEEDDEALEEEVSKLLQGTNFDAFLQNLQPKVPEKVDDVQKPVDK